MVIKEIKQDMTLSKTSISRNLTRPLTIIIIKDKVKDFRNLQIEDTKEDTETSITAIITNRTKIKTKEIKEISV